MSIYNIFFGKNENAHYIKMLAPDKISLILFTFQYYDYLNQNEESKRIFLSTGKLSNNPNNHYFMESDESICYFMDSNKLLIKVNGPSNDYDFEYVLTINGNEVNVQLVSTPIHDSLVTIDERNGISAFLD